ncbi:NAD(P)/FAD-dependent oxidoreductase [Limnothrix sp. PR1529]|uniref:FAD-dependent oxidoreductase n=1 Tax=Limnothrix sp. PR1529 TaxID=1704291 RepID=UPI000AB55840|nr:2-polyprenyl-6-methoxyphenol hydroxylase-like oxidoreductase [Limnothrix sp. PR1529]
MLLSTLRSITAHSQLWMNPVMDQAAATHSQPDRAIVLGGSLAGLLAARVLADRFQTVLVLERDPLPTPWERPETPDETWCNRRPGTPQADHVHVLLARGQQILESLFPGFANDLATSGAVEVNWTADCAMMGLGSWNPRVSSDLVTRTSSRSLLESLVRRRLQAIPNVIFMSGVAVQGLVVAGDRVTGVRLEGNSAQNLVSTLATETLLGAQLVVDAMGRNSQMPRWLQQLGYGSVPEVTIDAKLGYASRWYQMPADYLAQVAQDPENTWKSILLWAKPPHQPRAGVLYPVEGNRWVVTVSGTNGDYPPADEEGFLAFVRSLRDPAIARAIASAQPISDIKLYRGTANRWRHYEQLATFPIGLALLGDAVCTFNPIYGQGMTGAALGAVTLGDCLDRAQSELGLDWGQFTHLFRQELARVIQLPWLMATGEDLRWPATEGPRPDRPTRWMQAYLERVLHLTDAHKDIHETVWKIQHMILSPQALFHPSIMMRVGGAWLYQRLLANWFPAWGPENLNLTPSFLGARR